MCLDKLGKMANRRLYTVEEQGKERQYVTSLKNKVLYFPFKAYLWTEDKRFSKEPISQGETIVVNDSNKIFHEPKYPFPTKVLDVEEVFDFSLDLRLYLLSKGKDNSRRVIIANNQNLVYNHSQTFYSPVAEAITRENSGFSDELFDVLTRVKIRPVFEQKGSDEIFSVEDTRIISWGDYVKTKGKIERREQESAFLRFKARQRYSAAMKNAKTPEEREMLERQKQNVFREIKNPESLEEMLERVFFGEKR